MTLLQYRQHLIDTYGADLSVPSIYTTLVRAYERHLARVR